MKKANSLKVAASTLAMLLLVACSDVTAPAEDNMDPVMPVDEVEPMMPVDEEEPMMPADEEEPMMPADEEAPADENSQM